LTQGVQICVDKNTEGRVGEAGSMIILHIFILVVLSGLSVEHGRMLEPPSRASAWRVGFPTPKVQCNLKNMI